MVLFRIGLAMIRTNEAQLRELHNSADIFNWLSDLPRRIRDVDELLDVAYSLAGSLTDITLDSYRRRHLAYLMVQLLVSEMRRSGVFFFCFFYAQAAP